MAAQMRSSSKEHIMVEEHEDEVVELGIASEVTRGQAIVNLDVSGGQLNYLSGITDD
jgi:hypothetical protein